MPCGGWNSWVKREKEKQVMDVNHCLCLWRKMSVLHAKYKKIVCASQWHETRSPWSLLLVLFYGTVLPLRHKALFPAGCNPRRAWEWTRNPGITRSSFIAFSAVSRHTVLPERLLCRVQYPSCSSSPSTSCLEGSGLCPTSGEISLKEETSSGLPNLTVERNHFVENAGGHGWCFRTRVTITNTFFVCGIICLNK